jgi:hypothetical protein
MTVHRARAAEGLIRRGLIYTTRRKLGLGRLRDRRLLHPREEIQQSPYSPAALVIAEYIRQHQYCYQRQDQQQDSRSPGDQGDTRRRPAEVQGKTASGE